MRASTVTRAATLAALCVAVTLAALVLLRAGGSDYRVVAQFENASQLVKGNEVQVAGIPIGTVQDLRLAPDGQAEAVLRITDPDYAPVRRGTQAIVRQASLSGVANRYIDLRLAGDDAPRIPDGGTIEATDTLSAVDLDQVFDVFDPRTRRALSGIVRGSAVQWRGRSREASAGLLYLNPALAATNRLIGEIDRDTPALERFIVSSARLSGDVAARRDDLEGLVDDLATDVEAVASRSSELGETVDRLPPVLRRTNSTFVDLRAALDDLDPLVAEARPAVRALRPLSGALRGLARDGVPAVRDLRRLAGRPGAANDLRDLLRRTPALRDAAVRDVVVGGERRPGALPAATPALEGFVEPFAFLRPYSVDLTGWFNDFATSGVYDALGATGRIATHTGAYSAVGSSLSFVPPELRDAVAAEAGARDQRNRCPGAMERGTAYQPEPGFDCDLTQVPPGR